MEDYWGLITPLPESTWTGERGWMKVKDKARPQTKGPRALRGSSVPDRGMAGCRDASFIPVPCSLYPRTGNTLPLDQPVLSEPRQPDQRQSKGPPAFLGRPGLLGAPSSLTAGGSSLRPFSPRWTPAWSWGCARPALRRGLILQAARVILESLFPRDGLQRPVWLQKDGEDQKVLSAPNY